MNSRPSLSTSATCSHLQPKSSSSSTGRPLTVGALGLSAPGPDPKKPFSPGPAPCVTPAEQEGPMRITLGLSSRPRHRGAGRKTPASPHSVPRRPRKAGLWWGPLSDPTTLPVARAVCTGTRARVAQKRGDLAGSGAHSVQGAVCWRSAPAPRRAAGSGPGPSKGRGLSRGGALRGRGLARGEPFCGGTLLGAWPC